MKPGAVVAGMLDPFDAEGLMRLAAAGLTGFALEAAPRITRAQSLDVLSSQANAGYKAVLLAAHYYGRLFPMMMTAAGTLKAARAWCWARAWRACRPSPPPSAWARWSRPPTCVRRARAGRIAGREIHRRAVRNRRGARDRPGRGRLCPTHAAVVDGAAGGAGVRALQAGRHHHHHRADPGPPGATLVSAETVAGMKPGSVLVDRRSSAAATAR